MCRLQELSDTHLVPHWYMYTNTYIRVDVGRSGICRSSILTSKKSRKQLPQLNAKNVAAMRSSTYDEFALQHL